MTDRRAGTDQLTWALIHGSPAVLSVRQPWAWALVNGHKDIENRTWRTTLRGLIGIHAGQRPDGAGYRHCEQLGLAIPEDLPLGAVVGAVEVVDVVQHHSSPWASSDEFNWVVGRAFTIPPVPMVGKLGLFDASPDTTAALLVATECAGPGTS